ncbi:glutathione s-transferase [Cystoisospora suis]|uniref:Glutathione s-transferase n=1 Tax=Cystoisospora suis TaxID=483139 RepID=A0A2C6LGH9_9APIC|nr:glutathione s-transferase [Cystoisospora suis]
MEFHAGRSMLRGLLRNEFAAAGLPDNLPYYSDGICEMTGASTVLRYIARKTGLMGETAAQGVKIDSVVDYSFAVLQSLWRAGCQCGTKQKLSEDRAKAKYFKEVVLPLMLTLDSLVPDYDYGAPLPMESHLERPDDGVPSQCVPPANWIFESFSVADITVYSCTSSIAREFGESSLVPFTNLRRHSEAVEYHRRNIRVFIDSPHRY